MSSNDRLSRAESARAATHTFTGRGYKNGRYSEDTEYKIKNGTKYSHVGNRTGLSSLLDESIIRENMQKQNLRTGPGVIRFAAIDDTGNIREDAVMNIDGRIYSSNGKRGFSMVDEGYLDILEKQREEQDQIINKVLRNIVADDDEAAYVLGFDLSTFKDICETGDAARSAMPNISTELASVNCLPSYLDSLPADHSLYTQGLSKLRYIVKSFMPILTSDTKTSQKFVEKNKE